jgi:hypothetical protein
MGLIPNPSVQTVIATAFGATGIHRATVELSKADEPRRRFVHNDFVDDAVSSTRRAEHLAAFFKTEDFLASRVAWFVAEGLASGDQIIVLATHAHRRTIRARLADNGIALDRAEAEGRVLWLDAAEVLSALTVEGVVDVEAFRATLQRFIDPRIRQRLYGELVSLLRERGDVKAAIAIESLGHQVAHTLNIPVLCGDRAQGTDCLSSTDIAAIESAHDRSLFEGQPVVAEPLVSGAADQARRLHAVRFYENRESLAKIVGTFLGEGFVAGLPAIVIATPQHTEAIKNVLATHYFDITRLQTAGDLILLDASESLSQFMPARHSPAAHTPCVRFRRPHHPAPGIAESTGAMR